MGIAEFYSEIGVDINMVIKRLGLTEKHLKKYLLKFTANQEYAKLCKAVQEEDYYNVEWAAHTLKGVASNLGLNNLLDDFQLIVDSVRKEKTEDIQGIFDKVSVEYEKVMELLAKTDLEG